VQEDDGSECAAPAGRGDSEAYAVNTQTQLLGGELTSW